jgi:hypothetical protein
MSDYKLYTYKEFRELVLEKRQAETATEIPPVTTDEDVNENIFRTAAMAASLAAASFGGAHGVSAAPAPAPTEQAADQHATSAQIDAALSKLEHRKQFKMKFDGDKSSIIGIGQYDYPIYKAGSAELSKYMEALHGAKDSTEKFFWANGLVYANPYVDTTGVDTHEVAIATDPSVAATADVHVTPEKAPEVAASTVSEPKRKATMNDISSFVVKAQGLWDLHQRGGKVQVKLNGAPKEYTNKNAFVKDYVVTEYTRFVKAHFNEEVDTDQVVNLMDDAIARVGS